MLDEPDVLLCRLRDHCKPAKKHVEKNLEDLEALSFSQA
jgi:hypothetical protein